MVRLSRSPPGSSSKTSLQQSSESSGPSKKKPCAFPKSARLRQRHEFLSVQSKGSRAHSKYFTLVWRDEVATRIGITISTKVDKSSVQRNKLRRRIRELLRMLTATFSRTADIVIIAKQGAQDLSFDEVRREMNRCLKSARFL